MQAKQDAYPSPFYHASEINLNLAYDWSSILPPQHWFWPTLFLLSHFFPDLTSFLSSSQFPMRTLAEYLGSIFHQSCPSFCDAIIFRLTSMPLPGCWNCPSSYMGERLLSCPVLKLRQKRAPLLPACVLRNMGDVWNCLAVEPFLCYPHGDCCSSNHILGCIIFSVEQNSGS